MSNRLVNASHFGTPSRQATRRDYGLLTVLLRAGALASLSVAWIGLFDCQGLTASARAQMPQSSMGQPTGMVNRLFGDGDGDRPGWFYYGLNAADRGLGYRGSYMTLGGYIPYAEDDLGGFWAADLRGHLSTYGGFFSNVGLVRKQFIGGTLLGVGVFWDYDGDQNQYSDTVITDTSGSYVFAGGQTYNQVGVSGEWLTDFGALRSNGYIPVGTTAALMGPFVGNSLLAVNGVNAALGGADLEVGAYVPGLADWAGMISVGGYALGNTSYSYFGGGSAVPAFGGVYTRLDMTFIKNWDFSLQANNDSYFDWTGFARLTYRMGSSRRRNVPDQLEQPMLRNEHIVRAHQAPVQAINPTNGLPWRIIHIDNSNAVVGSGNGTFENPYKELRDGRDNATQEFDVIYLHAGISQQTPYSIPVPPAAPLLNPDPLGAPPAYPNLATAGSFYFNANNQYLVGEGSSLRLNTVAHGPIGLAAGPHSAYPMIANAAGAAIILTDPAGTVTNATVDHIQIRDSYVGISDGPNGLPANGYTSVNDVRIVGTGPSQRGVEISHSQGVATFNFTNMSLQNLSRDGFYIDGATGAPNVNITDSQITNTGGSAISANNVFGTGRVRAERTTVATATGPGVYAKDANLTFVSGTVRNAGGVGVYAEDNSIVQVAHSTIENTRIGVQATAQAAGAVLNATINDNVITVATSGNGIVLSTPSPENTAEVRAYVIGNRISQSLGDGIQLFDGSPAGLPGSANLSIKAADAADLRILNGNTTVRQVFPFSATPEVPAPPNYDPTLFIPLPPQ